MLFRQIFISLCFRNLLFAIKRSGSNNIIYILDVYIDTQVLIGALSCSENIFF